MIPLPTVARLIVGLPASLLGRGMKPRPATFDEKVRNMPISDWVRLDGLLGCDVLRLGTFVVDLRNGVFELVN